ncbi:hypothetical protein IKF92_01850 [Candidatus Saccharibacteria bacterium]|nr:hypothetical protein [Candidatus Saccharibacteria bacterium]
MTKTGDTLIEVTLAVGIFSMVAIAIIAVMSNGTSNSQTALETTLAREEIDTQSEALRFIQASYLSEKDSPSSKYASLWGKIVENAIDVKNWSEEDQKKLFQFTPEDCQSLYKTDSSNNIFNQKAFIINPRKLNSFTASNAEGNAIFSARKSGSKDIFKEASTYPRLIYGYNNSTSGEALSNTSSSTYEDLFRAEGIYIVAVKDNKTTEIVNKKAPFTDDTSPTSAFYDFYIRTCWYGTNAEEPSTISTVIRLYDPDVITPGS